MQEIKIDLRNQSEERMNESRRTTHLLYQLNNTEMYTENYERLLKELFTGGLGDKCMVQLPLYMNFAENLHIGNNVVIMPYFKCMSAGQIYIDDDVRIAMNVSLITNNHDMYEREILLVKDIHICKNAWIGANATIMPGVTIGENAVVGAGSIVTKDVAPNTVVVGAPAKEIRTLDPEKFKEE